MIFLFYSRPQELTEISSQEEVVRALTKSIETGNVKKKKKFLIK
jgi:hypothetical protein